MNADGHGVTRCTGRMLVALLWLLTLGACDSRPSAPETRASYFVQKFIHEPQNHVDLRAVAQLADNASPESLTSDLQTRTAVSYLRARHRLGAALGFHIAGTVRTSSGNKVVTIVVSEAVATVSNDAAVRFQVELHQQNQAWFVTRLQSD